LDPEEIKIKKTAALISLVIGFLLLLAKFVAYFLTQSVAILSDALESIVHVIAVSFAFYSIIVSMKPPDAEHPYGHGKIEYFSAGFEGAMICIAALSIIYYAIRNIIIGIEIEQLDSGILIITGASIINLVLGLYLVRRGKSTDSIILVADGKHVLTDVITSVGAVIALLLVLATNIRLFDPIVALILAVNISFTGVKLMRQSIGGLMNETDDKIIGQIAEYLENSRELNPQWIDIHRLRYWKSGDTYNIDFHMTVPYFISIDKSDAILHNLENDLKKLLQTDRVELFIHMDPCTPTFCRICAMKDCNVRSEPQSITVKWDGKKIISNFAYVTE